MKTRSGFVSNSSSSSFIIKIKRPGGVCPHCHMKSPNILDAIERASVNECNNNVLAVGHQVVDYIKKNWFDDERKDKVLKLLKKYKGDDSIAFVSISYHDETLNNLIRSDAVEIIHEYN